MANIFQRLAKRSPRRAGHPTEPQLSLAAFGKHPGWDDHIPGIGVETDVLAYLMQNLYVSGIGGQIDSGAWETLEPEKRLDGFDHTFLWLHEADAVLGQIWSSMDRKGRSKYPMVLCLHGEGIRPELLLGQPQLVMKQVREGCKASTSAHHVGLECQAAQDQLRAWLANSGLETSPSPVGPDHKRRFLNHPAFGVDQLGLCRVMHELDNAMGRSRHRSAESSGVADLRPYHVRVPLCSDSPDEGLLLWTAFLRCVLPEGVSLLLIARHGADWLDLILGDVDGNDLFCLQASPKALPLATDVPYDLAPDSKSRLGELEAKFLGIAPPESPPQKAVEIPITSNEPDPPGVPAAAVLKVPRRHFPGGILLGVALVAVLIGIWMVRKAGPTSSIRREANDQTAFSGRTIKSNDSTASGLQNETARVQLAAAERIREQVGKYQLALSEAQNAFNQQDYPRAIKNAESALAIETNDLTASKLKSEAARLQAAATERIREQEGKYQLALDDAQTAFNRQDYPGAIKNAESALAIKTNDLAASKLINEATRQQAAAAERIKEQERKYQSALNEAQAAFNRQDYAQAIQNADLALTIRTNDASVVQLRSQAQAAQAAQAASAQKAKELEQTFQAGLNAGKTALNQRDYGRAIAQADAALAIKKDDPGALDLKRTAQQEQAYQAASELLNRAEYDKALNICLAQAGTARFDSLGKQARGENSALLEARKQLSAGDYSFLGRLEQQSYKDKPPFAALLTTGRTEQETLLSLLAQKDANQWQPLRDRVAKLAPEVRSKKPFADLDLWVEAKAGESRASTRPATQAPFDNVLEALEVRFGLKEEDPAIVERDGAQARKLAAGSSLAGAERSEATAKVEHLEDVYRSRGLLNADRKSRLRKLAEAIRNWK